MERHYEKHHTNMTYFFFLMKLHALILHLPKGIISCYWCWWFNAAALNAFAESHKNLDMLLHVYFILAYTE